MLPQRIYIPTAPCVVFKRIDFKKEKYIYSLKNSWQINRSYRVKNDLKLTLV